MNTQEHGSLYVVATPIGHLDDITFRAVNTLKMVTIIACEDTRETKKLLDHYGIEGKKLLSYHGHSSDAQHAKIIQHLVEGEHVAIVSDRGTPAISDPGERLVRACVEHDITIIPIPGASALITALQASGVSTASFKYLGFIPHKKGRQTMIQEIMDAQRTIVCYESPHRILKTLEALQGSPKQLVIGRELTKTYEEFLRGTAQELLEQLSSRDKIKGEFVLIASPQ